MDSNNRVADGPSSPGDVRIEPATQAEYRNVTYVAKMHLGAWKDRYEQFVPEERRADYNVFGFVEGYCTLIEGDGYTMWLAKLGDDPVGVAIFGPDGDGRGKIDSLYIAPEWQGQGIGTRLLEAVLDEMNYPEIVLNCAVVNTDGCGYWEHRGFQRVGPGETFPIQGHEGLETVRFRLDRGSESSGLSSG